MEQVMAKKNKCRKQSYETVKKANGAKKHMMQMDGRSLWVYKCNKCNLFHLTSVPR